MTGHMVMVRKRGSAEGLLYVVATPDPNEALAIVGRSLATLHDCDSAVSLTSSAMVRFFGLRPGEMAVASYEANAPED